MALLGPGVTLIATEKATNASSRSTVMRFPHRSMPLTAGRCQLSPANVAAPAHYGRRTSDGGASA